MKKKNYTPVVVVTLMVVAVAWDIWTEFDKIAGNSISELGWAATLGNPWLVFLFGFVAGHLFWQRKGRLVSLVFDGPPSAEGPRFIEIEDEEGKSVLCGEWVEQRETGTWALQIRVLSVSRNELGAPAAPVS
jgi:hypothetical protein